MTNENRPRGKAACDHAIVRLVIGRREIRRLDADDLTIDDLRFECRECGTILTFDQAVKTAFLEGAKA